MRKAGFCSFLAADRDSGKYVVPSLGLRLHEADTALARRLARADSGLYSVPQHGGLGDSITSLPIETRSA